MACNFRKSLQIIFSVQNQYINNISSIHHFTDSQPQHRCCNLIFAILD